MTRYIVIELVAGKWFVIRSYDNEADAQAHAKWIGRKAKIKTLLVGVK